MKKLILILAFVISSICGAVAQDYSATEVYEIKDGECIELSDYSITVCRGLNARVYIIDSEIERTDGYVKYFAHLDGTEHYYIFHFNTVPSPRYRVRLVNCRWPHFRHTYHPIYHDRPLEVRPSSPRPGAGPRMGGPRGGMGPHPGGPSHRGR